MAAPPLPRPRLLPRSGGPAPDVVVPPANLRTVPARPCCSASVSPAPPLPRVVVLRLRDAAADPALAWGQGHAAVPHRRRHGPGLLRGPALGASMVRITGGRVIQYPRAIPFLLMLVAAAGTLYFNATHVPTPVRPRPGRTGGQHPGHPRAGVSAEDAGRRLRGRRHPPRSPALELNRIIRTSDVLHGEARPRPHSPRPAQASRRLRALALAASTTSSGSPKRTRELGEATKRQQIEAYLAGLDGQLATTTRSQVAAELTARGMPVDETYAGRILGEWRIRHSPDASRKRGNRGR